MAREVAPALEVALALEGARKAMALKETGRSGPPRRAEAACAFDGTAGGTKVVQKTSDRLQGAGGKKMEQGFADQELRRNVSEHRGCRVGGHNHRAVVGEKKSIGSVADEELVKLAPFAAGFDFILLCAELLHGGIKFEQGERGMSYATLRVFCA